MADLTTSPEASREPSTAAMLKRIFAEHGRKHIPAYALAAVMLAIGAAATALSAWLLKPVVNGMMDGEGFRQLRSLAWGVTALFALRGVATYFSIVILSRTGNKIVAGVQMRLFDHLLRQDMRFFNAHHSTDFMTRLAFSANGVRDTLQAIVLSASRDALTIVGLICVMLVQDPMLAIIALVFMPIAGVMLGRMIGRIRKFALRSYDGSSQIMQIMQETVHGSRIVKSFNLENRMREGMKRAVREVESANNRMSASVAISGPITDGLAGLAIGAVIFYGSWRVTVAHADAGSFFSFVAAMLLAYEPAKRLGRLKLEIQNGLTGARLIYDILDRPAPESARADARPLKLGEGRVVLDNVQFRYREGETVLNGVSFEAKPNTTTALVGPSGGGKSTIVALIQRFYEPDGGRILIDGQDIAQVDLVSLRDHIAFVSQDVFLFRGTIGENIALGRADATRAEIEEAARKAHAHEFIVGFEKGYDTDVGEQGGQLSGGQKQRIAIARAVLKNAPIILLDEPTAALDSETERMVQLALDELRVGRTTLVVAHRLQTIVNADTICVVDGGAIVQIGNHAALIAQEGGPYHSFFAAQFGDNLELVRPPAQARS